MTLKPYLASSLLLLLSGATLASPAKLPDWFTAITPQTTADSEQYDCSHKYCKQMRSCAEARYKLEKCGHTKLDRDGDGIPCENVCGKKRKK